MADPAAATNIWDLLVAAAWPVGGLTALLLFKGQLVEVLSELSRKLRSASNLKVGGFELKGPSISPNAHAFADGHNYELRDADASDDLHRQNAYEATRGLMLVHRIRPSATPGQEFDISFFFERKTSRHFRTAEFMDVDYVEYYLGRYFGEQPHGSWYVVRAAKDGFAVTTSAYGSPLCVARVHFRDGVVAEVSRYLDFQMGGAFNVEEKND